MDILQNFGIQTSSLIFYTVNFFILLAILRIFAYKPVMQMLDKRKALIEKSVKDAESIAQQKEKADKEYRKIIQEAQKESKDIVQNAMNQSTVVASKITEEAKKDAETLLTKAKEEIARERSSMYDHMKTEMTNLIAQTLSKVLEDSLTAEEQAHILHKAVDKINT